MGEPGRATEEALDTEPQFVHLHTHSHYSLLTCPVRPEALVQAAAADGQKALALTDNGNLFGAIEFYKACKSEGIKPILGMSAYYAGASSLEKRSNNNPTYQLTLLACSQEGFENLKRLSTHGHVHGFHYQARIDQEVLARHSEGILVLSGGTNGPIERQILSNNMAGAKATAESLQQALGEGNFYLELMSNGSETQDMANQGLLQIHRETGIPVVATNDVHYLTQSDWGAQQVMLCIRDGKTLNDPSRFQMRSHELFLKSRAEMVATFQTIDGAIENSLAIAERCNVEIQFNVYHLPIFDTETDESPDQAVVRIVNEGAKKRYRDITPTIRKRIDYELSVIKDLGFPSYFLITADFIKHARSVGIPVGPGRGSAAGSIVAYCMWITDLDPLKYNLIFERFLNAERLSMPDIDVDFCGNRRDEVINYCREKYNPSNVSQIITFGTMASRGVLRDVGRVLDVPLSEIDKIAKKVPQGPGASLKSALKDDKELQSIRDENETYTKMFHYGCKLEGLARHNSIHAAGVVIADRPVADYVPLAKSGDDIVTQWQMTELDEVGLLKVDFLGLKTLTILAEAVRLIQEVHGIDIDLASIPLDDAKTFELMTTGDTLGVFQLESSGMRELLAKLKPDTFEDVIAVLALYRPGPLGSGMVDMFVDRKHGREIVEYPHESLESVLKDTYGVIVYQEQVMRTANIFAGFSMNQADALRQAMGKKKPEVMAKFKALFVDGATSLGHQPEFSTQLFETIEFFAGYGFNKSHSAAYALLTFQTAYLKVHYPVETYAANLTTEAGNSDKVKEFVDEIRAKQITLTPPSVNTCLGKFNARGGELNFGLRGIKGVGERIADAIGEERKENGDYKSMIDFCERHDPSILNKTALDALCKAGAFDCMGSTRRAALESIGLVLRASAQIRQDRRRGQGSLFAMPDDRQNTNQGARDMAMEEWSESELLSQEKSALGFYLSGHPFKNIGTILTAIAGHDSETFHDDGSEQSVRVAGMISALRILQIRSGRNIGKKMARFVLEDLKGAIPVTCFPHYFEKVGSLLADDEIVFARGRPDSKSEVPALLLDEVVPFLRVLQSELDGIVVRMGSEPITDEVLDGLANTAEKYPGDQKLLLEVAQGDDTFVIRCGAEFRIRACPELLNDLAKVVGNDRLTFTKR